MTENVPLFGRIWAIREDYLRAVAAVIQAGRTSAARLSVTPRGMDSIDVIPIVGALTDRGSWFGPGYRDYAAALKTSMGNSKVSAVVLEIDSPGGEVYGVQELADQVYAARQVKPVVSVASAQMASAAYWIGSQATEVMVTPSGEAGSIGVLAAHEDWSRALDQEGVTVSLVYAGEGKVDGNPFEPLTEETRAALQADVNRYYGDFVAAVARGRGASRETIRGDWKARIYGAKDAVSKGLADRVGTVDDAVRRAAYLARGKAAQGAQADAEAIALARR